MNRTDISLDSIAKVLIRCFWIGVALAVVSFVLFLAVGDRGYEFHKDIWTGLTRHQFDLIWLCLLAAMKTFMFMVFLVPYFAIRMVLRQSSGSGA